VVPLCWSLDHVGPLCRTVEDAALLTAIAGYDELDPTTVNTPVPDYSLAFGCKRPTCGWVFRKRLFFDSLDPEIEQGVDAAITVAQANRVPKRGRTSSNHLPLDQIFINVRSVEAYAYHSLWLAESLGKIRSIYPATARRQHGGCQASSLRQLPASASSFAREIRQSFEAVDLLITPTVSLLPADLGQWGCTGRIEVSASAFATRRHLRSWDCLPFPFLAASRPPVSRSACKSPAPHLPIPPC
jgi:aspartyl-tRNA(Asn)/glutamyl-tRNA(Gln) amidotransferase subunit A